MSSATPPGVVLCSSRTASPGQSTSAGRRVRGHPVGRARPDRSDRPGPAAPGFRADGGCAARGGERRHLAVEGPAAVSARPRFERGHPSHSQQPAQWPHDGRLLSRGGPRDRRPGATSTAAGPGWRCLSRADRPGHHVGRVAPRRRLDRGVSQRRVLGGRRLGRDGAGSRGRATRPGAAPVGTSKAATPDFDLPDRDRGRFPSRPRAGGDLFVALQLARSSDGVPRRRATHPGGRRLGHGRPAVRPRPQHVRLPSRRRGDDVPPPPRRPRSRARWPAPTQTPRRG